jgi:hypothetical protein
MAENMARITDNTKIKPVWAFNFAAYRQTVTINHHLEILQMITPEVRL